MPSIPKKKKIQPPGIGTRLRGLREKEKMSVRAFAKEYGFNYPLWNEYENDKRKPNATTIKKLCDTFGVTADWILFGSAQLSQSLPANKAVGDNKDVEQRIAKAVAGAIEELAPKKKK